jgi:hypothetical protein
LFSYRSARGASLLEDFSYRSARGASLLEEAASCRAARGARVRSAFPI